MAHTSEPTPEAASDGVHEAARREKMRRIAELGHDPWGARFDDRTLIGEIRKQASEIRFVKQSGEAVELPEVKPNDPAFRQWLADQGPGEMKGPKFRAAGRVVRRLSIVRRIWPRFGT